MLDAITVHGFKSIADLEELELGRINVFIGANGSGKSALLESIGVLGAAAGGRVDDAALLQRGVRPSLPALYKSSFHGESAPPELRFSAHSGQVAYEVGLFNPTETPEPRWRYHTERLDDGGQRLVGRSHRSKDKDHLNPEAGLAALKLVELDPAGGPASLLAELRDYRIFTPGTTFLRGTVQDPGQGFPLGLSGGRLAEAVDELLKRLTSRGFEEDFDSVDDIYGLLGWTKGIELGSGPGVPLAREVPAPRNSLVFVDRFMAEGRNKLTAYDASEGALYVLAALVIALHPNAPRIAAIDNFDQALNPRLARALMERVCLWSGRLARERQLLLTTHNPLVLDGLPLADDPSVRLFAVDRTSVGHTAVKAVRVTPELVARAKEGWTLSRLWVMGHLGGVPSGV